MKMYKFKSYDNEPDKIKVVELDVEEKPKTYKVIGTFNGVWGTLIPKSNLDRITDSWSNTMFSLSPNKSAYIKKLIDINDYKLTTAQQTLNELDQRHESLSRLYESALEEEGEE